MLHMDVKTVANHYYRLGWVPLALGLDAQGLPKRPLALGWTSLQHDVDSIRKQPWDAARGIGILLGSPSGNLAAIDVDDVEMAETLIEPLADVKTRVVRTIRNRLHIFCYEETPSASVRFTCKWRGRDIGIELKATGTQVATWPTPGYALINDCEPIHAPSVEAVWLSICRQLDIEMPSTDRCSDFPRPWQPHVEKGERNKAVYIEAHKLREAGLAYEPALEIMAARLGLHYTDGDMAWREAKRTIESAYRKPVPQTLTEDGTDDNIYFR